jgi:membrane protein implicated in regulation of membrane protease activity
MSDIVLPAHIGALVWLVSGFVLCAAETMAPGAFLIWVGLAASIVGAIAYFVTFDLTSQLLLFGALVTGLVLLGRRVHGSPDASPGPLPQSRAHAMVGADFFLDEAIVRGYGRIRVGARARSVAPRSRSTCHGPDH